MTFYCIALQTTTKCVGLALWLDRWPYRHLQLQDTSISPKNDECKLFIALINDGSYLLHSDWGITTMYLKIRNQENFWAGILFLGFGLLTTVLSQSYPMGVAMQMGPGYFPFYLGIILAILGFVITCTAFRIEGEPVKPFAWRGIFMLSVGFSFFGWAVDTIGFLPALVGLIACSAFAMKGVRVWELLLMGLVLIVGSLFVFIYLLNLPYPIFNFGR